MMCQAALRTYIASATHCSLAVARPAVRTACPRQNEPEEQVFERITTRATQSSAISRTTEDNATAAKGAHAMAHGATQPDASKSEDGSCDADAFAIATKSNTTISRAGVEFVYRPDSKARTRRAKLGCTRARKQTLPTLAWDPCRFAGGRWTPPELSKCDTGGGRGEADHGTNDKLTRKSPHFSWYVTAVGDVMALTAVVLGLVTAALAARAAEERLLRRALLAVAADVLLAAVLAAEHVQAPLVPKRRQKRVDDLVAAQSRVQGAEKVGALHVVDVSDDREGAVQPGELLCEPAAEHAIAA